MKKKVKYHFIVMLATVFMMRTNTSAQEIASVKLGEAVSVSVQVCGVFKSDRSLWVFKPGDPKNVIGFEVSEDVKNFDQIEVGDMINVTYYESVTLSLNAPSELPEENDGVVVVRAAKGEKPGGVALKVHDISAIIKSYDEDDGIVTLIGPKGNVLVTEVSNEIADAGILMVGKTVHVRYTQALAISVEVVKR
ncbi:MAG: hypothetical protein JRE23_18405 [Deltaproteobacteria bacterium]|nr:hypothetical protein [Deltaproteobacteria bacterium]